MIPFPPMYFPMLVPVLTFFFGLGVGSFLNVVAIRFPKGENIIRGRSRCLACRRELRWVDMIPGLSFFLLRGKCRFCKVPFSSQYVIVELASGMLFFLVAFKLGAHFFEFLSFLFFAGMFLLISAVDIRSKTIPFPFLLAALGGGLLYVLLSALFKTQGLYGSAPALFSLPFFSFPPLPAFLDTFLYQRIAAALFNGGVLFFLVIVTRERGMGMGDVPIGFLQGLLLGYPGGLLALFLSFIIGAAVGVALILKGKAGMKTALPFAPFLVAGFFIVLFVG